MIHNYVSFLQIMAALYLTMSIDNLVYKRFWTPNYEKLVKNRLSPFSKTTSSRLEAKLTDAMKSLQESSERTARIWGLHFCLYTFFLVLFSGYEQDFLSKELMDCPQYGLPLLVMTATMLLSSIIFLFLKLRYLWVIISFTINVLLTSVAILICRVCTFDSLGECGTLMFCVNYIEDLIVMLIIIPIVLQIIYLYVTTIGYDDVLGQKFSEELKVYNIAYKAVIEEKENDIPEKYHKPTMKALMEAKRSKSLDSDNKIRDGLFETLLQYLIDSMQLPSMRALIRQTWQVSKSGGRKTYDVQEVIPETTEQIPSEESQINESLSKYSDYIEEYQSKTPFPKISDFCKKYSIDEKGFRFARKAYIEARKK